MKQISIKPQIDKYDSVKKFVEEFKIGEDDLIFSHKFIYEPMIAPYGVKADTIFQEEYGVGEPSSTMINKIFAKMEGKKYKRIIAIGGGSVIDIAKLLVFKEAKDTLELFEKKVPLIKDKELVIVPTTCGTGSEVTNLAIVEIVEKKTKMGLAADEMYADYAVLIPELVKSLPYKFFLYSSVDALIHAVESYVSPKSNPYTELFSTKAAEMILKGYKKILTEGEEARYEMIEEFLIASNYAGIAFGNTGVGAVHAMSYPLGGNYHVPHGEANYQMFTEVFKTYAKKNPKGKIKELNKKIAKIIGIETVETVYEELDKILSKLIGKKKLSEYGMKEKEIEEFTDSVIQTQQRLLVNNYVALSRNEIRDIYKSLY